MPAEVSLSTLDCFAIREMLNSDLIKRHTLMLREMLHSADMILGICYYVLTCIFLDVTLRWSLIY